MDTCTRLQIICKTNPDWNGVYDRDTVVADLSELGLVTEDPAWLEWVIDHMFLDEIKDSVFNAIVDSQVTDITIKVNDDFVRFKKA